MLSDIDVHCMLCDIVYVVHGPFGWSLMEKKVRKIQ